MRCHVVVGTVTLVAVFATPVGPSADSEPPRRLTKPVSATQRAATPASSTPVPPARSPELTPPRRTTAALTGDGATVAALASGEARPVGLAAADFDGDGFVDVAAFYALGREGAVVVHRADPAARGPYRAGETRSTFVGEARVFAAPFAPDFFGAGDLDNDGRADVLVASKGQSGFAVLRGDGEGSLGEPRVLALGGRLTALAVGSVNHEDSLLDIVAAMDTAPGASVRVYESPDGAVSAAPEVIAFPTSVTALAIGELDGDGNGDIVALARRELLILEGRDRRLDDIARRAAAVGPATLERRPLAFEGREIALGRFHDPAVTDIVVIDPAGAVYRTPGQRRAPFARLDRVAGASRVLAAHVSGGRRDDLVALDGTPHARVSTGTGFDVTLELVRPPVAALPLDLDADAMQDLVLLEVGGDGQLTTTTVVPRTTLSVTNTANAGVGSLRQAILDANLVSGLDEISFAIPGAAPHVISTTSPLPTIVDRLTIDGRTQPGWAGAPIVFLDGAASGAVCGLCFSGNGADGSAVLGLGVVGVFGDGIRFDDTWLSVVDACYAGVRSDGATAEGNVNGVAVLRSQLGRIGTTAGNVLSGNSNAGIYLEGGPSGATAASSDVPQSIPDVSIVTSTLTVSSGAVVEDIDVTLDITHTFDGDLRLTLISPLGVSVPLANHVGGGGDNFAGTTFDDEAVTPIAAGVAPFLGSYVPASALAAFDGGPVGGTWTLEIHDAAKQGSGTLNAWSLAFQHRTHGNTVQANRIGTNAAGTADVPNTFGVFVNDEAGDQIGGPLPAHGNLISGNLSTGVWIQGPLSRGNRVEGNRIGTILAGTAGMENGFHGVALFSGPSGNTIGGTGVGTGNTIGGLDDYAIAAQSVRGNRYQGNFVGTDVTGTVALPTQIGIITFDARDELIGGVVAGARNLLSGCSVSGVTLRTFGSGGGNSVVGNAIGTNASGTAALGNRDGVLMTEDGDVLERNVISGNVDSGVGVHGTGNVLIGNHIGVDTVATTPIPNRNGVLVSGGRLNTIGAPSAPPNVIAGNLEDGVRIEGSPALGPTTYVSTDAPAAIADLATSTSLLSVLDDGVILDVDVRVDLVHTFDGDIDITLTHPSGLRIPLALNRGGAGDDYAGTAFDDEAGTPIGTGVAPFAGGFRPERPLADLDGRRVDGIWTLEITDEVGGDSGTLNAWQITVVYAGALDNGVYGNYIGTNVHGAAGLENGGAGVHIVDAAGNRIGNALGGNTISGNGFGLRVEGIHNAGNLVQHNYIGQTSTTAGARNVLGGVALVDGFGNEVSRNRIARNRGPGVSVTSDAHNHAIRFNEIFDNDGLGIDLGPPGVNPNDVGDGDGGPNDLQNYPVITSVVSLGASNQLLGSFDAEPGRDYELDFYASPGADPAAHGEGMTWLGSLLVDGGGGPVPFAFLAPAGVGFYSATATAPGGSTSEFSGSFAVPQEVPDTMLVSKAGPMLELTYTPACGAADHAVFWGTSPIGGSLSWTHAQCVFGATGHLLFDPGVPAAGQFFYWAVVGQTFSLEGSYGQSSSGVERPEAIGLGLCDLPLSVGGACP